MDNSAKLYYVIGPSGVGKDSILNYCREHQGGIKMVFLHRYITRPAKEGNENHIELNIQEFIKRKVNGLFALDWDGNGLMYGIGKELDLYLSKGFSVLINGSRGYLPTALKLYPDMQVVLITADAKILEQRLRERGRETEEDIQQRLQRATAFKVSAPNLVTIQNNSTIEAAAKQLFEVINHNSFLLV